MLEDVRTWYRHGYNVHSHSCTLKYSIKYIFTFICACIAYLLDSSTRFSYITIIRELPFHFLGEGEIIFSEQSISSLCFTKQTIHSEINMETIYFLLPTNYLFWQNFGTLFIQKIFSPPTLKSNECSLIVWSSLNIIIIKAIIAQC